MLSVVGICPLYNVLSAHYPFLECIVLTMPLVNKMIVQDGGSTDGTREAIQRLSRIFPIRIVDYPHYKGKKWEAIDRGLELVLSQVNEKWVIEIQADEYFHPKHHRQLFDIISYADKRGYNAIRQRRRFVEWKRKGDYIYRIVRIFRNLKNIRSKWGGDSFYFEGQPECRKGFSSHNLPPELDIYGVDMYHVHELFPYGRKIQRERHYEFYAQGKKDREALYLERRKYTLKPIRIERIDEAMHPIFHGLAGEVKYRIREELFDLGWLKSIGIITEKK